MTRPATAMRTIRYLLIPAAILAVAWIVMRVQRGGESTPPGKAAPETRARSAESPASEDITKDIMKSPAPAGDLARLEKDLLAMDPAEAVRRIREALASGRNRSTGMDFAIGADRGIDGWPTLRTFLLDMLFRIDPRAAAETSRGILESPDDPDEWAIAMRNIASAGDAAADRTLLIGKTTELIRNPQWQANPSIGYLNAFDVLVHTSAVESTPLLSGLVRDKQRRDLAHAAFLTIDRLVQRSPAAMLERIAADTELMLARPEMTAQQFARADLREDDQRELVRNWLLSPDRTAAELRAFAGIYPNNNRFVSNNLLTSETPQSGAELAAHDRAAAEILKQWSTDPAFSDVKPHLDAMLGRLSGFIAKPAQSNSN